MARTGKKTPDALLHAPADRAHPADRLGKSPSENLPAHATAPTGNHPEDVLEGSRHLTRQILLSSHQGIVVHDRNLRYLHWNPFMEHLTGVREEDVLGRHPLELFPFMVESGLYDDLQKTLGGDTIFLRDIYYSMPVTGQEGWCNNTLTPLRGENGDIIGVVATVTEISEQKQREDRLRRSEALLAQAEQLANMGSWELDLEKGEFHLSAHLRRMLGLESETGPVPYNRGMQMIHADDRARALRDIEEVRFQRKSMENELCFVTAKGGLRIFHSRAVAVTDAAGCIIAIRGMSQDVTGRKSEEEKLRKDEALLSQAEQMANFGSWEFDFKTQKATLSRHLMQMYGVTSEEEWTVEKYLERLHPKDRERAQRIRDRAVAECRPWEYTARYNAPGKGFRVHHARGFPLSGPDGKAVRSIGVAQDITEQTKAEGELRRLSQELLRARDDDRRRMAQALHESAGQSLVALRMVLGHLSRELPQREKLARDLLLSANELAGDAIREVRTISYLMHPPMLDEAGLAVAVQWYAKGFSERSGIAVKTEIPGDFSRHSQEIETTVFRVVQEALTNVHRYSGSSTATIRLACENGQMRAEVQDEGRGLPQFDPAASSPTPLGVGIAGMRERVEQLNGTLEIESEPGQGTTVRAILPLGGGESSGEIAGPDEPDEKRGRPRAKATRT